MVKNDQNSRNGQKISKWTIWSKMVKNGKNTISYDFAKNYMLASQFARFAYLADKSNFDAAKR